MGRLMKPSVALCGQNAVFRKRSSASSDTLYKAVRRKYEKYADNFAIRFASATGKGFVWKNITPENIDKFVQYLSACGLSPNTINQYCKKLKAIIGLYMREHNIDAMCRQILTTQTDDCYFVYINDNEIIKLFQHLEKLTSQSSKLTFFGGELIANHNERQITILKQFLVGLYTGARHSDYINFSWNNIHEEQASDGAPIYVLTYISEKTGIKADVPLSICSPIVDIIKDMPRDVYTTGIFNRELRAICMNAGLDRNVRYHAKGVDIECKLYEAVTSHTARRSFASNYLSDGADIVDVMHFMGHTNTTQTLHYNQSGPKFDSRIIQNRSGVKQQSI